MRGIYFAVLCSSVVAAHLNVGLAQEPAAAELPTALQDYVTAKDDAFAWKIRSSNERNGCLVYDIDLTSQVWQGITWKHAMSAVRAGWRATHGYRFAVHHRWQYRRPARRR